MSFGLLCLLPAHTNHSFVFFLWSLTLLPVATQIFFLLSSTKSSLFSQAGLLPHCLTYNAAQCLLLCFKGHLLKLDQHSWSPSKADCLGTLLKSSINSLKVFFLLKSRAATPVSFFLIALKAQPLNETISWSLWPRQTPKITPLMSPLFTNSKPRRAWLTEYLWQEVYYLLQMSRTSCSSQQYYIPRWRVGS